MRDIHESSFESDPHLGSTEVQPIAADGSMAETQGTAGTNTADIAEAMRAPAEVETGTNTALESVEVPGISHELKNMLDNLDPAEATDCHEAYVIDARLSLGSPEYTDDLLIMLSEQVDLSAEVFANDVGDFIGSSPETGVPSFAVAAPTSPSRPGFEDSGQDLQVWLPCAKKHDPETASAAVTSVVERITEVFDPVAFAAAASVLPNETPMEQSAAQRADSRMSRSAENLATRITNQLIEYATDPAVVQQFASSDFMQAFGDDLARWQLACKATVLRAGDDPLERAAAYNTIVARLGSALESREFPRHYIITTAQWLGSEDPATVVSLAETCPSLAPAILFYGLPPPKSGNSEAHLAALEAIMQSSDHTLWSYLQAVESLFESHGAEAVTPAHAERLFALFQQEWRTNLPDTKRVQYAGKYICARLPIEDLASAIQQWPDLAATDEARRVAVRRLARADEYFPAIALASRHRHDHSGERYESITNLLTIYEETGRESAWEEAISRLTHRAGAKLREVSATLYELTAKQYAAARTQHHPERMGAALRELETGHSNPDPQHRLNALGQTIKLFVHSGDVARAEQYAAQYHDSAAAHFSYLVSSRKYDAVLVVAQAYTEAGQYAAAQRLITTCVEKGASSSFLISALQILAGKKPAFAPLFMGEKLEPLIELRGRRPTK